MRKLEPLPILSTMVIDSDIRTLREVQRMVIYSSYLQLEHACKSGRAAMHALRGTQPDLIIFNPKLSDMNGYELINSLDYKPLAIIMADRRDYAFYAFRTGAMDYLEKPITSRMFTESIEQMISRLNDARELEMLRDWYDEMQRAKEKEAKN